MCSRQNTPRTMIDKHGVQAEIRISMARSTKKKFFEFRANRISDGNETDKAYFGSMHSHNHVTNAVSIFREMGSAANRSRCNGDVANIFSLESTTRTHRVNFHMRIITLQINRHEIVPSVHLLCFLPFVTVSHSSSFPTCDSS